MNDHDLIILNGIKKEAIFSSVQVGGNSVVDYIICDQNFNRQVKNFVTWEEEFSLVSDHRLLTIEVDGALEKQNLVRQREQEKKEGKKGWRREIRDRKNLEKTCEEEMKRWCEEYGEKEEWDSEKVWQTWLDTHNKIAEATIGRYGKKKKRRWMKGEWDQGIFEAVREKNRLRREMGRVGGEKRKEVVEEYRKWKKKVKRLEAGRKKGQQRVINERLENFQGTDEKNYWKYLKNLAGLKKEKEELPEEVQIDKRVGRGEKRKELWNEAFSRLGKFILDDENFDKQEYIKIKQEVEKWERERKGKTEEELDREIEFEEVEKALRRAKSGKAAGDDGCVNEILKGID